MARAGTRSQYSYYTVILAKDINQTFNIAFLKERITIPGWFNNGSQELPNVLIK